MPGGGPHDAGSRPITERSGCAARSICRALGHDTFVAARADGRRRRRLAAPSPTRTDPGTTQSSAQPTNRYQEVPFTVVKKHRQFHVGVDGITAPLVFTRRVVGDITPR
jgi:hypothetical protein